MNKLKMFQLHFLLIGGILFSGQLCIVESFDEKLGYEYNSDVGGWLRLMPVPATASDARLRCYFEGGILATPTTRALTSAMINKMGSQNPTVNMVVIGVPSMLYPPWARGESDNNMQNSEDCLAMTDAGEMTRVNCKATYKYICHKHGANLAEINCGTWDPEYKLDRRTHSCYKFHTTPRTWFAAEMACRAERAHLAVINSDTEDGILRELFAEHLPNTLEGIDYAHIGFRSWQENKKWHTVFGETLQEAGYGVWRDGEPSNAYGKEYCGSLHLDGKLNDYYCDRKLPFICEIATGA